MGNRQVTTNGDIQARILKGWKPNRYLSNMSMAYFANQAGIGWQRESFQSARLH